MVKRSQKNLRSPWKAQIFCIAFICDESLHLIRSCKQRYHYAHVSAAITLM